MLLKSYISKKIKHENKPKERKDSRKDSKKEIRNSVEDLTAQSREFNLFMLE